MQTFCVPRELALKICETQQQPTNHESNLLVNQCMKSASNFNAMINLVSNLDALTRSSQYKDPKRMKGNKRKVITR